MHTSCLATVDERRKWKDGSRESNGLATKSSLQGGRHGNSPWSIRCWNKQRVLIGIFLNCEYLVGFSVHSRRVAQLCLRLKQRLISLSTPYILDTFHSPKQMVFRVSKWDKDATFPVRIHFSAVCGITLCQKSRLFTELFPTWLAEDSLYKIYWS